MFNNFHFGLTGWPLGHSLSPLLHRAALAAHGLEGQYQLFPIPPQPSGASRLEGLLQQVRNDQIQGLNVTIPHKQTVISWLDELTPLARRIGAVNTIYVQKRKLVGDNTDAPAFITDLSMLCGESFVQAHRPQPVALLLGAGGAARAVALALAEQGWQVKIAARRLDQAQRLADNLNTVLAEEGLPARLDPVLLDRQSIENILVASSERLGLIINATPVGMQKPGFHNPQSVSQQSPWPANLAFPTGTVIYDLVYNPPETPLIRDARRAGLEACNGLGMLIEQAALSFDRWTGLPSLSTTRAAMRAAVLPSDSASGEIP